MKNILILLFVFGIALGACKKIASDGEGMISYKITYPSDNPYRFKAVLPGSTDLIFKGNKACFITSAGLGMIKLVNILDQPAKKYTSLLINNMGENLAFTYKPEELQEMEETPKYSFQETNETKVIAGIVCNKALVRDLTNKNSFDIFYYKKIKMYYGSSPYKKFNYLLMEYPHTINKLPMNLVASSVDFRKVDTSLFSVKGDFKWVDSKFFFKYLDAF